MHLIVMLYRRAYDRLGLNKPHMPFVAPQRFFDLYANQTITPAEHSSIPDGMPMIAWQDTGYVIK
jgi:iduronate 2-sulfatase